MVTSEQASSTARRLLTMFENDRQRIETIGRGANSTLRVHNLMRRKPLFSIAYAKTELQLTVPTITSALKNLENFGMVKEVTGRSRDRLFVYSEYLNILNEGI